TLLNRRPDLVVDLYEERIDLGWFRGRTRDGAPLVLGDCHSLPLRDNSFDTAVLSDVLEHVPDPRRCLEEAYRVARKRVVATVPRGWHRSPFPQYTYFYEKEVAELIKGFHSFATYFETPYWKGFGIVIYKK
ncbi:MAG: class I SAM-dependent methyltransferase, partial [Pyrobaculum sp.]